MDLDLVAFMVIGGITLLSSVGVVVTRNVIYAALFLLAALLGVAGLFVLLYAEFLALVQIFIYGGAIIIVILFALMLTRTAEFQIATDNRRAPFAALFSIGLFAVLVYAFVADAARFNTDVRGGIPFIELARSLFVEWVVPFEMIGLLLLVALIGAVVLARVARNIEEEDAPLPEEEFIQRLGSKRDKRAGTRGRRSGSVRR